MGPDPATVGERGLVNARLRLPLRLDPARWNAAAGGVMGVVRRAGSLARVLGVAALRTGFPATGRALRATWSVAPLGLRRGPQAVEALWNVATLPATTVRFLIVEWMLRRNAIPIADFCYFRLTGAGAYLDYEIPPTYAAACAVILLPAGVLVLAGVLGLLPAVLLWGILDARLSGERVALGLLSATLIARAFPDAYEARDFLNATAREAAGGNPWALLALPLALLFRAAAVLPPVVAGLLAAGAGFYGVLALATRLAG